MNELRKTFSLSLRAALLGSVLVFGSCAVAQATSMEDAVRLSLATNPDIGVVAQNREAVDQELRQARGLYLPQVDVAAGIGQERHDDRGTRATDDDDRWLTRREASVIVSQRIFDGFETAYTVQRDKARVKSAANRVFENSEFLGLDAVGSYHEVVRQRELVDLADENVQVHISIVEQIRQQIAGGGGSRADLSQSESRLARARSTLSQTINDLRDSEALYTRVVGQFPDDLTIPEFNPSILPGSLNDAIGWVNDNNPTVKIFEADVRSAQAEIGMSEAPFYPHVNLEIENTYDKNREGIQPKEVNNNFMLRMRWNIFRGGIDRAARQEALARMSEAKNRRLQSLVDAQEDMRNSWFALQNNQQRAEDLSQAVIFARETAESYREQFDVAQRTLLDVLDAENELFVSSGQLVTAEINELLASYRVLALGGRLLNTLGVPAPEESIVEQKTWAEAVGLELDAE